jgi:hypothetical protein
MKKEYGVEFTNITQKEKSYFVVICEDWTDAVNAVKRKMIKGRYFKNYGLSMSDLEYGENTTTMERVSFSLASPEYIHERADINDKKVGFIRTRRTSTYN